MKKAESAVKVVDGRVICTRCGKEMRRPKHSKLRGHLFCSNCNVEALYLNKIVSVDSQKKHAS